jgi:hypothetical protein
MDIVQQIMGPLAGSASGIVADLVTVALAVLGCLVIVLGASVIGTMLRGGVGSRASDGVLGDGYNEYARKRYAKELNEKTYKAQGIGKVEDISK